MPLTRGAALLWSQHGICTSRESPHQLSLFYRHFLVLPGGRRGLKAAEVSTALLQRVQLVFRHNLSSASRVRSC